MQENQTDCGLFAIAFAVSLCFGHHPEAFWYTNLREHLTRCFEAKRISQFPVEFVHRSTLTRKLEMLPVYCICRLPEGDGLMVQCDQCFDWFHSTCVSVPQDVLDNSDQHWACPDCTK